MSPDAHLSLSVGQEHDVTAWERAAAAVLRKARRLSDDDPDDAVWEKLTRRNLDGIRITPLGTPALVEDLPEPVRPPARGDGWDVRALLIDPDAQASHAAALTDLENGVTSLWIQVGESGVDLDDLATVLDGVLLDVAPVVLDAPSDPLGAARAFAALATGRGLAAGTNLGVDPVGAAVRTGGLEPFETVAAQPPQEPTKSDARSSTTKTVVEEAASIARGLGCRALVVDGTAVHDLGASDVQELGYVLALGAHYLRELASAGVPVDEAAALVEFRLAASDEQFETIAKLRAVRRLWARMLELSGAAADHRQMVLHAVTSRPMMTKYDPWVNMLRTCVAAFAAGVGGADAVTVLPFDSRLGLPDAFSRRIARNTSSLLVEESHVAKVADPAGGAFAVEKLTDDLAVAGWEELGRIEAAGGVLAAIEDGSLRSRIDEVVEKRDHLIANRKLPLTGVTEFPNLHETLPEREQPPISDGAPGPVRVRPYGAPFEAMRDEPMNEPVFLATMGTIAAHTARATFASNLFAAGGIGVVNEGRHDDVEGVLAHYDGQPVVCLVGHDKAYAEWGAELAQALRAAGARWVILAGKPVESIETDDTCAMGVDALDFLHRTREKLGVVSTSSTSGGAGGASA
jgi:methylmalonyl-CoA mutase